jgi:aminoglycoside phosphotransferase (APT) family kinase protein
MLPLRVPMLLFAGKACPAFPWPWSVCDWIPGEAADAVGLQSVADAPRQLAGFLEALRRIGAEGAPMPGQHNAWRGEALIERDLVVRKSLVQIADLIDLPQALTIWDAALAARPAAAPGWLHGDLLPGNLLLQDGRLAAIVDFGLLAVGDAACDLMAGWTLFGPPGRAQLFETLQPDVAALARGRGWALAFAAVALPYYRTRSHPLATVAAHTLEQLLRHG